MEVEELVVKRADVKKVIQHHKELDKRVLSLAPLKIVKGVVSEYLLHLLIK